MKTRKLLKTVLLFSLLLLCFGCQNELQGDLIIKNVSIIDVETGDVIKGMDVVIIGDSIANITEYENSIYNALEIVDGTDKFLIPGLWDMHTHTWWAYQDFFPLLISNGVTGVREMFGDLETTKKIRTEIENGDIVGPLIYTSGPIVDGDPPAWPSSAVAGTPEKGRDIVRQQKEAGADFIKVYSLLSRETYFAIADECKKQNITFSGHIPRIVTLEEAVAAGHHSTEHFNGILEFQSSKRNHYYAHQRGEVKDTLLVKWSNRQGYLADTFDENRLDSLITLLSDKNFWIDPTSTVNRSFSYINDPKFREDDRVRYMPDYTMFGWNIIDDRRLNKRTDADYENERKWYNKGLSIMKPMLDGGAKFLAGTDYPNPYTYPGFSLHDELQIFVEKAGFTPLEALQTATINPAIFMERESEFGTVEEGKLANLVLLNKSPLKDIKNTKSIEAVIVNGNYLKGEDLRNNLEAIAAKNKLPKIREKLKTIIDKQGMDEAIAQYYILKKEQPEAYNYDEEQLNTLGYELMEEGKHQEAIKIFELNIEVYPEYLNGYDSLGDGYLAAGEKKKAIAIWEKAVEMGSTATRGKLEELKSE